MAGWLPENFGDDMVEARARRAVGAVRKRARRRREIQAVSAGLGVMALGALAFTLLRPEGGAAPQMASAPPTAVQAPQAAPPDITLLKNDDTVELAWSGDPSKEYVVYRCSSPRFDTCAVADVVKGTGWKDPEMGTSPVVFYKVEPKGNS